jgi:hypothetical protein
MPEQGILKPPQKIARSCAFGLGVLLQTMQARRKISSSYACANADYARHPLGLGCDPQDTLAERTGTVIGEGKEVDGEGDVPKRELVVDPDAIEALERKIRNRIYPDIARNFHFYIEFCKQNIIKLILIYHVFHNKFEKCVEQCNIYKLRSDPCRC